MILHFTQQRLYVCKYMNGKIAKRFRLYPKDNKIPNSEAKALMEHPGIKRRLDLGILIEKQSMTEDLKGEAEKNSKAKKEKLEAKKEK